LRPPIDIVGYPTFRNYDFQTSFRAYRLAVWVFPALVLAGYLVLSRWGPLAASRRGWRPVALIDAPADPGRHGEPFRREGIWSAPAMVDDVEGPLMAALRATRLLPTLAVVVLAAGSGSASGAAGWVSTAGVLTGLGIAATVVTGTAALTALSARARVGLLVPFWRRWGRAWSLVHAGVAAVATVCALTWFARRTVVVMADDGSLRYPWVPLWLGGLALAVTAALLAVAARAWSPHRVEAAVVRVLVGAAFVYLATSQLNGDVGPIQGFDDMQSVTGGDLLSRGFFPWKDFLFIHGLFEDVLRSSVGFLLFEHTLWGTWAALGMIWIPLTWTGGYLVAAWGARDGSVALIVSALLLVWGSTQTPPSVRWVAAPLVLILLGEAVRRSRLRWTALLTGVLFVNAVLVPEASFQVISVVVVLVASDLTHRPEGRGRWRSLTRTRHFVLVGAVLTLLWVVYLLLNGAFRAFVDYYLVFGPGHVESGALPLTLASTAAYRLAFLATVGLAAGTLWWAGVRLVTRRPMSSRHWVAVGSGVLVCLYGEKALGRFADHHIVQVITVALPLALLWLVLALSRLDQLVREAVGRRRATQRAAGREPAPGGSPTREWAGAPLRVAGAFRQPVSLLAVAVLVVGLPSVARALENAPGNNTTSVSGQRLPRLGYISDGAVDVTLLRDLRSIIDAYAPDGSVFDFTNSPGYFYYLLGEDPPTSYFHVSMAVPEYSQEQVVDQLEDSRPELVVVQAPFGLPGWDGPHNIVRHFMIAQYVLDHYTPVLRARATVFLARNDLIPSLPAPPDLSERPEEDKLWFAMPPCDFGTSANFLSSEPEGEVVDLKVGPPRPTRRVTYGGWAYDDATGGLARKVLLAVDRVVVDAVRASRARPDVAATLDDPAARASGFGGGIDTRRRGAPTVYAVLADGRAHPVGRPPTVLRTSLSRPGGTPIPVAPDVAVGAVETLQVQDVRVSEVHVPAGTRLDEYSLLTVGRSNGALGKTSFELSDSRRVPLDRDHRIVWESLPVAGDQMRVRVGSCLQWHGYQGSTLYLTYGRGRAVDQLSVSGVS
jgi:hypothetical protein